MFTKAEQYSFSDILNGCLPRIGDYVGPKHVWDGDNLIPTDTTLDLNGHLPNCFKISKNGNFDPYHWCQFSTYFWLDEELVNSLHFIRNKHGDFVSELYIRGKKYLVIIDEPKRFIRKGVFRFESSRFIFSTQEINFEGQLDYQGCFPLYYNQYCFFVMII